MEVPVNVNFVEGFGEGEVVYSREEAAAFFKEQEEAKPTFHTSTSVQVYQLSSSKKPWNLLMHLVQTSTVFLWTCDMGRFSRPHIKDGEAAAREWLRTEGRQNIEELNAVLAKVATPWTERV